MIYLKMIRGKLSKYLRIKYKKLETNVFKKIK